MSHEIRWTDEGPVIDILRKDGSVRCTNVRIVSGRYANRNIMIEGVMTSDSVMVNGQGLSDGALQCAGEPWGTLTVSLNRVHGDDIVCVKDYSEGEGYLKTLVSAGIVEEPYRYEPSGFVKIPVCRLTETGKKVIEAANASEEMECEHGIND